MLAMEDFCQLDLRLTQDKYRGSYERCAKIIGRYSIRKGLDMTELYLRLIFSFLVGNSDMHLKNFSLIEEKPGNRFRGTEPGKGAGMAEEVMIKENKMGTQPLRSLLLSMSLPIMISMIVQALYNVVDSIFVAILMSIYACM